MTALQWLALFGTLSVLGLWFAIICMIAERLTVEDKNCLCAECLGVKPEKSRDIYKHLCRPTGDYVCDSCKKTFRIERESEGD